MGHGGDWAAYEQEYGREPLDFSASVSPLGVPEGVKKAICEAASRADRYPDPACRALTHAIAERERVPTGAVLCGNGASELIWQLVQSAAPRRALVTAPCFGEYEAALQSVSCEIRRFPLDGNFRLAQDFPSAITEDVELLLLCQPNNPSGVSIDASLLRRIARRCEESGTRLVLDECFVGFLDEPGPYSLSRELERYPHLVILSAFTKLYGMAGVRLGYVLSADAGLLSAMRRSGQPWKVSGLAQAAGLAALREQEYAETVRSLVHQERPWLFSRLSAAGLHVVPGEANYLLFRGPKGLDQALKARGILIRCCGDYAGLDDQWYRVAVRTHRENERLTEALREVMT